MMDTPKMITINRAQKSQSGKTLRVQDKVDMRWYSTKAWELEQMAGHTIYAQTSESEWQGQPQYWINDYTTPEGQAQAVQAAPLQGQQPATVNPAPAPLAPPSLQGAGSGPAYPPPAAPPNLPRIGSTERERANYAQAGKAIDRDASIVAQVLCKTVTFSTVDAAFYAYIAVYEMVREWQATGRTPQAEQDSVNQAPLPGDDIPF